MIFVGAGISHQALSKDGTRRRLPLWSDLASEVEKHFSVSSQECGGNLFDLFDYVALNRGRSELESAVRALVDSRNYELSDAHKELAKLPWHLVYTTNYDDLLQRALGQKEPIVENFQYEQLKAKNSSNRQLIHLHGTLQHFRTLTGTDFALWQDNNEIPYQYLKQYLSTKTFLFVGYSFSDPHLSRGVIPWLQKVHAGRHIRHYAWMWQVTDQQRRLLDKRDEIDALPIVQDQHWAEAFRQLAAAYKQLVKVSELKEVRPSRSTKKPRGQNGSRENHFSESNDVVAINSYKLFYFRTKKMLDHTRLAERVGGDRELIRRLEKAGGKDASGKIKFPETTQKVLTDLENVLGCHGRLMAGQDDDLLAVYTMYYKANRGSVGRRSPQTEMNFRFDGTTKAVVFDFGGTLTVSRNLTSTWERIWSSVGYSINDAGALHEDFVNKRISHRRWCELTCDRLRARGFSRDHLMGIIGTIKPVSGLRETFQELYSRGIPVFITSGSLRDIIVSVIGDAIMYVHEIKSNEMLFDNEGIIRDIWSTSYDFEGKGEYIKRVALERRCETVEVLFVGNSLNDHWAASSGARTLCVNPGETDYTNALTWTYRIKSMANLNEILKFV